MKEKQSYKYRVMFGLILCLVVTTAAIRTYTHLHPIRHPLTVTTVKPNPITAINDYYRSPVPITGTGTKVIRFTSDSSYVIIHDTIVVGSASHQDTLWRVLSIVGYDSGTVAGLTNLTISSVQMITQVQAGGATAYNIQYDNPILVYPSAGSWSSPWTVTIPEYSSTYLAANGSFCANNLEYGTSNSPAYYTGGGIGVTIDHAYPGHRTGKTVTITFQWVATHSQNFSDLGTIKYAR
jgi:hypothetical protein